MTRKDLVEAMPNFYNLIRARKFSTSSDTAIEVSPSNSATPNFALDAGGRLRWGSGSDATDTNLYRTSADVLKTDDSFDVGLNLSVTGRTDVAEIRELISNVSVSSGTLTCNYAVACVFYLASMSGVGGNFTVNVTNVPTDNNYAMTISIIVNQGSTGHYPSVLQIAGTPVSIRWVNDAAPSVNANRIDIYNFTLIRVSSAWVVLGSASNNYDTI